MSSSSTGETPSVNPASRVASMRPSASAAASGISPSRGPRERVPAPGAGLSIAVVTDSGSQLPADRADRHGIAVVPLTIVLDGVAHAETGLDADEFYERLDAGASVTTSLPSPGALLAAYDRAAEAGARAIVSLHLDGRLSGTVGAARLAAADSPLPVTVVDTRTASYGVAVCALAAARAAHDGRRPGEIAAAVQRLARSIGSAFASEPVRSGRLPAGAGDGTLGVATLLDGVVEPVGACAGQAEAVEVILDSIPEGAGLRLAVGHAAARAAAVADELAGRLAARPGVIAVERYRAGPSIGAHAGPGSFGVFWWRPAERAAGWARDGREARAAGLS